MKRRTKGKARLAGTEMISGESGANYDMSETKNNSAAPDYGSVANGGDSQKALCSTKVSFVRRRQDLLALVAGLVFILTLLGLMFALGIARGWDAPSPYAHNTSATSRDRFLSEPFVAEPGNKGRYGVDRTARWYYWRVPPSRVTWYSKLFPWVGYVAHQLLMWAVLFWVQQAKNSSGTQADRQKRYSSELERYHYVALGLNVFFHLLHLLQTHVTYDGTAQDVSVSSSQGSVIAILLFILLIEYRERGIVLGWPRQFLRSAVAATPNGPTIGTLFREALTVVRRYHGYGFAWGAIYTFWYHPMENTAGHALGFFHTWIIMLQGSLAYTPVHLNKYWRFLLETWVTLHGFVVAYQTGGPDLKGTRLWPMFAFGFLFVVVFTQLYGLPFWRRLHWAFRFIPPALFLALLLYSYSWIPNDKGRTWVRLREVINIPMTYYLYFVLGWLFIVLLLRIEQCIKGPQGGDISAPSTRAKVLLSILAFQIYVWFVWAAWIIMYFDVQLPAIVLMIIFISIFVPGISIFAVLMRNILPRQPAVLNIAPKPPAEVPDTNHAKATEVEF